MAAGQPAQRALVEGPEELGLHVRAQLAQLVQEDGAAVGLLEQAGARGLRAGEGAALVAEQLGLQEGIGDRRAVDRQETSGPAGAGVVDGARHELLARAALAQDHHARVDGGRLADLVEQPEDGPGLAHHPAQDGRAVELTLEEPVRVAAAALVEAQPYHGEELVGRERFVQVVPGPHLHRLHGRLHRGEGGDQDDDGVGVGLLGRPQDFEAAQVGHPEVDHDDVDGRATHHRARRLA